MNQMNNTMVQGQGVGLAEELKQGMGDCKVADWR